MVLQMLIVWLHHMRLLIALPGGTGAPHLYVHKKPQSLQ